MTRALLPVLIVALLLGMAAPTQAGDEDDDVHKAFNDLYPAAFRARVHAALERGAAALIRSQRSDGSWSSFLHHRDYPMGSTALAVLTLLKCGTPKEHPAVVKAFEYLRTLPLNKTYSVAVLLMALDARYAPARDPFAVEEVDRYGNRAEGDPCEKAMTPEDLAWMKRGVDWLLENQNGDGVWRYPHGGFDLSNTQFALLGLHAASRCGATVPQRVWLGALRYVLAFQEKEGEPVMYKANEVRGRYRFEWTERALARGFRYSTEGEGPRGARAPTGSMTTAGLACLVICQSRLWRARAFTGQLRADTRRGVRDGVAWLQHNFRVDENPGSPAWHLYYLYGLERAGILGRYRFLGTHDWYLEGAEWLLPRQQAGGWWPDRAAESTCFALLFLKRATARMQAPVITPSGSKEGEMPEGPRTGGTAPAPSAEAPATRSERLIAVARALRDLEDPDSDIAFQGAVRLGALGHLRAVAPLTRALRRNPDADVRCAAAHALGRLRAADAVESLIDALDDTDDLARFAAERALLDVTAARGLPRLDAATSRNDRVRIQKAWRAWWSEQEESVRARLRQPKHP